MSDHFRAAVISEVVSRAASFLTGKYSKYKTVNDTIYHMERQLLKMKAAVEVSETIDINIEPLHEWKEKLKEALSEAEEMIGNFKARIPRENLNRTIVGRSSSRGPLMQEEGYDDQTLVHPASNVNEVITRQVNLEAKLQLATTLKHHFNLWPAIMERLPFARLQRAFSLLKPRFIVMVFDDCVQMRKVGKTMEKIEIMAGDVGDFIELLKLQSKRKNMSRKRKRGARQCFFLVISLQLQTYALFCCWEDPPLLVIKLFRTNCNIPTVIASDIFIRFII